MLSSCWRAAAAYVCWYLPAVRASLHASYMSCLISGLSSAIVSPTVINRSTAKLTDCPMRSITRSVRSAECCRSDLCCDTVDILIFFQKDAKKRDQKRRDELFCRRDYVTNALLN